MCVCVCVCVQLPAGCAFHVVPDPPHFKIGCGGATLHVLRTLEDLYGSARMDTALTLISHAGGYSQR